MTEQQWVEHKAIVKSYRIQLRGTWKSFPTTHKNAMKRESLFEAVTNGYTGKKFDAKIRRRLARAKRETEAFARLANAMSNVGA